MRHATYRLLINMFRRLKIYMLTHNLDVIALAVALTLAAVVFGLAWYLTD